MHSESDVWWASRILMAFCILAGFLAAYVVARTDRKNGRKQADCDADFGMPADGSPDAPGASEIGGADVAHHCDPGFHAGSFDGGCGGHH